MYAGKFHKSNWEVLTLLNLLLPCSHLSMSDGDVCMSLFLQRLGDPVLRPFLQVFLLHLQTELYARQLVFMLE